MSRGHFRTCVACGHKPRAQQGQRHCYDCTPGGPLAPPGCRRCRSISDGYPDRLCDRCQKHGARPIDSCRTCNAWGATRLFGWICRPCQTWNIAYPLGACINCRHLLAVNGRHVCRLCWRQAARSRGPDNRVDPIGANRDGQQLFLADMHRALHRKGVRPKPARPRPAVPQPVTHRQLVLFAMGHDLSGGYSIVGDPPIPALVEALYAVNRQHATAQQWSPTYAQKVRAGIRVLLALQDTPGARITRSEAAVLEPTTLPTRSVCDVLAAAGMLEDDRTPTVQAWFERQIIDLPDSMSDAVRLWFDVILHGSVAAPRRRPRSETTGRVYLRWALPALAAWAAAGHSSLREVSAADVVAVLPAASADRAGTVRALRSIFSLLKARKIIFVNPAARLRPWVPAGPQPLPLEVITVRQALMSPDPARAAIAGIVAFCGLRAGQLRNLQLADVRDGRLYVDGRPILLAGPVRERLATYLAHRQQRWPRAINAHLFINTRTDIRSEAVGYRWLKLTLDIPGGVQAVREDRILHEAHATGGDPRRICDLFGLSITAATRYTNTVDHPDLLAQRRRCHEADR